MNMKEKDMEDTGDQRPKCSVKGCVREAEWKVFLDDDYGAFGGKFHEEDFTCPYLCDEHKSENEAKRRGVPTPRGEVWYPHTNRHGAQGWTSYERLLGDR